MITSPMKGFGKECDILIVHGLVGPQKWGGLEDLIAFGINQIMFCGGGGVLEKDIVVGKLIVVDGSIYI